MTQGVSKLRQGIELGTICFDQPYSFSAHFVRTDALFCAGQFRHLYSPGPAFVGRISKSQPLKRLIDR